MGFPKCDCVCTITAEELNYMYDPYDIKASLIENAVNVTKLNYCYSLADVDRDYMVIDVMTDSTGYNNTVLPTTLCCCTITPDISGTCLLSCITSDGGGTRYVCVGLCEGAGIVRFYNKWIEYYYKKEKVEDDD